jgi:hypothetical protein
VLLLLSSVILMVRRPGFVKPYEAAAILALNLVAAAARYPAAPPPASGCSDRCSFEGQDPCSPRRTLRAYGFRSPAVLRWAAVGCGAARLDSPTAPCYLRLTL